MHPYWHWHHRGPSRLWWFIVGAVSATWWIKSRESHEFRLRHCSRHRIPPDAYAQPPSAPEPNTSSGNPHAALPQDKAQLSPPPPHPMMQQPQPQSAGWGWGWNSPSWSQPPSPPPPHVDRWERPDEFSNKANEKFMEISEATIDGVLSTVESLKAKLAEHRAQREQQAKELQAMREEQIRQYEEWKKNQPPRHVV